MKALMSIISLAAGSLLALGADMGTLKPGARPAPAGDFAATHSAAAPARANSRAATKANFYTVTSDNSGSRLSHFTSGYSAELSTVMDIAGASGYSGTSIGDKFYYCSYHANSSGGITAVNWISVDVEGKKVLSDTPQTTANAVCMDMTYDVTTSTLYGMSALEDYLVTIDPATGTVTGAIETLPFYTISADASGQLYGILLEDSGNAALYSVNKLTGNAVKIGDTGVAMLTSGSGVSYYQTASFSRFDGRLYWLTPSQSGTDLYRVDVATGRAANMCTLATAEALCMFDLPGAVAAGSPGIVTDIRVSAEGTNVRIEFKAPTKSADGRELASISSIDIYRGAEIEAAHSVAGAAPGNLYTWTDTEAKNGSNAYRIVAVNKYGESLPVYATVFVGADIPQAPTGLMVSEGADGYPELSWTAPAKGLNGLDVDASALTYNIYRDFLGNRELIATGVKGTTYRDSGLDLSRQAYPYYYVAGVSAAGEGIKSAAAGIHTGPAYRLPFEEAFMYGTPATAPWTMQSLALGGSWGLGMIATAPGTGPYVGEGMLIFYGFQGVAEGAEARIVTPRLDFTGVVPELRFHFFHADFGEDLHFDDHMIVEVSVNGVDFEPIPGADIYQYTANTRWTEYTFPLDRYAGEKSVCIAFHGISAGGMDLSLDNIRVIAKSSGVEDITVDAPVEYYNLQGLRVANPTNGVYIRRQGNRTDKVVM